MPDWLSDAFIPAVTTVIGWGGGVWQVYLANTLGIAVTKVGV